MKEDGALRTMIVDDEPLAIERMQVLCAELDQLQVVGTASDGEAAVRLADKRGYGIGVANVRDRLEARFGGDAAIVSGPVPGGYSTQLRMPILHQGDVA